MTTHVDIELSTLEYTKLSDPFEMFTFDFTEQPSGTVPAYLNQSTSLQITATDIGQVCTKSTFNFGIGLRLVKFISPIILEKQHTGGDLVCGSPLGS